MNAARPSRRTAARLGRPVMRARLLFPVLLLAAAFAAGGQERPAADQHLVFNNGAEPATLDPALATGVTEIRLVEALFEGLTTLDAQTLEPRPGVAESWTVSEQGRLYRFRLRSDARWSDGRPVTAADLVASWTRVLTPATAASYANLLYPLAGAEDFHQGRSTDPGTIGVEARGGRELVVRLRQPCPYFLELTAFATLMPVPPDALARHGERWTRPEHLVGNGAFTLAAWEPRQRLELERSATYWDRGSVRLARVTALSYDDADTVYKLYQGGGIHWISDLPPGRLEEIKRHPDFYIHPYMGTYFYRFNVTKAPFDDARVRKAFSLAVDRRLIAAHVLKGMAQPSSRFCPPVGGYEPPAGLAQDIPAARRLLAEAGYGPGGKPFPAVDILYNTSESHKQLAEALCQQWEEALGVRLSLRNTEWKIYLADIDALQYQLARSSWIGDYNDPSTFYDLWVTDGGNNRTGWSSAAYDGLQRAAASEADPARRKDLFRRMERILVEEEFPILPLYIYVNKGLVSERVRGWHPNIRDLHPLKAVWLEEQ